MISYHIGQAIIGLIVGGIIIVILGYIFKGTDKVVEKIEYKFKIPMGTDKEGNENRPFYVFCFLFIFLPTLIFFLTR